MRRFFRRPAHRGERHAGRVRTRGRCLSHALRLERVRRDDKGRRRRDPELPRRRIPPLRGAHRRARERPHQHEFRALSDCGAEGGAGLGRGQEPRRPARHDRGCAGISRRFPRARRRLRRRQDRRARAWRREPRADGDRLRPHVRDRRPGWRVSEVRFHHLERRRVDEALPRILERALEEGRRVLVRASSEEMAAALNERLWTYDDASFLPHGAAGDGDPETQPIFLTCEVENPNAATMLVRLSGAEAAKSDEAFELALLVFDGRDEASLAQARAEWRRLKDEGRAISYWREGDEGGWERAR